MVRMFVHHQVTDFPTWLAAYEAFESERSGMGVVDHGVFRSTENRNDVTVFHDFASLDAAKAFATSQRLREVMRVAGVIEPPAIWATEPLRSD